MYKKPICTKRKTDKKEKSKNSKKTLTKENTYVTMEVN